MKLYMHPVSTASRPVRLFIAEKKLPVEEPILDKHYLGKTKWVAGDSITIADYFGACIVTAGELIGCTFEGFTNVQNWLGHIKKLGTWPKVNEVMYGFASSMKDKKFETV